MHCSSIPRRNIMKHSIGHQKNGKIYISLFIIHKEPHTPLPQWIPKGLGGKIFKTAFTFHLFLCPFHAQVSSAFEYLNSSFFHSVI